MTDSILNSVKKALGLDAEYDVFDVDVLMHINTVFADLTQIGIGPDAGFHIDDDTVLWADYLDNDATIAQVRSYVYLRVRMLFDPPTHSFVITSMQEQINKFEWRLNVVREETKWTDPDPAPTPLEP